MDIEYLLLLQNFRNAISDLLTPFMEFISHFAVAYLLGVPILVYWCVNRRKGLYVLALTYVSVCVNSIVKLTACVYRPWVKDPRVVPAGDAIKESTGYSFPSGHTSTAEASSRCRNSSAIWMNILKRKTFSFCLASSSALPL